MTQPDASPVPVPVRVMLTMTSSSDEPHSVLLEPAPFWKFLHPQLFQVHSCMETTVNLVILGWKNIFGFYIVQS